MRQSLGSNSPGYASTNAFFLPADGNWYHVAFLIDAADLTPINSPGFPPAPPAPLGIFLQSVQEFRILSSVSPSLMGDAIDEITRAGQRNRDEGRVVNVQAVFERA